VLGELFRSRDDNACSTRKPWGAFTNPTYSPKFDAAKFHPTGAEEPTLVETEGHLKLSTSLSSRRLKFICRGPQNCHFGRSRPTVSLARSPLISMAWLIHPAMDLCQALRESGALLPPNVFFAALIV
jgi:hypothetical protein